MSKWTSFWQNYRLVEIKDDNDLLYQVGLTVKGKPISSELFNIIVNDGKSNLDLNKKDHLLDLCCGNGLITFELSKYVNNTTGVDFSEPFIKNAVKFKGGDEIDYIIHDVTKLNEAKQLKEKKINKVFMYGALAYFTNEQVSKLLSDLYMITEPDTLIFIGNVLDHERIWNFYNTPKRKLNYFINHKILGRDPGVGKWWSKKELTEICEKNNFRITFKNEDPKLHTSHYRFDFLLSKI